MIYRAAQFTRFIAPTHAFGGVSSAAVIDDETVETNFIALRAPDRNIVSCRRPAEVYTTYKLISCMNHLADLTLKIIFKILVTLYSRTSLEEVLGNGRIIF